MKHLKFILLVTIACFGIATVFAQSTTYHFEAPQSCGVFALNYTCSLKIAEPSGDVAFFYEPRFNNQFAFVTYTGISLTVTAVTTNHLAHVDNGKKKGNTLLQGYIGMDSYTEEATFADAGITGSTDLNFTTTTQCCSSGRGPSAHTVWSVTSGTVTIQ